MNQVVLRHMGIALAASLTVALCGCSQPRTPEGFCNTLEKHKIRYLTAMSNANGQLSKRDTAGLLGGLAQTVSALGDLQTMWDELADVAPDEIRADVVTIRDTNRDQMEQAKKSLSDPLGSLGSILAGGFMASGSYARVDTYIRQECDARA